MKGSTTGFLSEVIREEGSKFLGESVVQATECGPMLLRRLFASLRVPIGQQEEDPESADSQACLTILERQASLLRCGSRGMTERLGTMCQCAYGPRFHPCLSY